MSKAKQYRKKPVVIEALLYDGNNYVEVLRWTGLTPEQLLKGHKEPIHKPEWWLTVPTLEGDHRVSLGDYIIKGVKGEFYPCKPDIFEATYEAVDSPQLNQVPSEPPTESES